MYGHAVGMAFQNHQTGILHCVIGRGGYLTDTASDGHDCFPVQISARFPVAVGRGPGKDGSADGNFLAWHDDHVIQMFRRHLDVVDTVGGASGKAGGTASCQHEIRAVGQDTLIYNRGEITGGKL